MLMLFLDNFENVYLQVTLSGVKRNPKMKVIEYISIRFCLSLHYIYQTFRSLYWKSFHQKREWKLNLAVEFRMRRNSYQLLKKWTHMSPKLRVEMNLSSNEVGEAILD